MKDSMAQRQKFSPMEKVCQCGFMDANTQLMKEIRNSLQVQKNQMYIASRDKKKVNKEKNAKKLDPTMGTPVQ